jgi:hypothetical protein
MPLRQGEKFEPVTRGQPITIAGLWDAWLDEQAGETVKSCAMVIRCE